MLDELNPMPAGPLLPEVEPDGTPEPANMQEPAQAEKLECSPMMMGHPMITLPEDAQREIVNKCNAYKTNIISHSREKKIMQQRCYAYSHNQFYGDDLLPIPAAVGSENNANAGRPQIFLPVVREQVKMLYSQLRLKLFPNDEDYFRVRSKTADGVQYEDSLTEGLKEKLKQNHFSEVMGEYLLDMIWSGQGIAIPSLKSRVNWTWGLDEAGQSYIPKLEMSEPELSVEILNPLQYYQDPTSTDPDRTRWGYFTVKKREDVMDEPGYQNKDKLKNLGSKTVFETQNNSSNTLGLALYNKLNSTLLDTETHLRMDYYYFPYLTLESTGREYRNMLFAVAEEQVLVDIRPNLFPRGLNPAVACDWSKDKNSGVGTGPVEDIQDLQRLINILQNYMVETLARIGNRFIVDESVDLSQFWGIAGGVATCNNPSSSMIAITGDYVEVDRLQNTIGVLKGEASQMGGAANPFQGSSNIDSKKTATEIQLLDTSSQGTIQEIVEHIGIMGIERIMERILILFAEMDANKFNVKSVDKKTGEPVEKLCDFSVCQTGKFTVELVSINASQSKNAQVQGYMQLLQLIMSNPENLILAKPIIEKIGILMGLKDIDQTIQEIEQSSQMFQEFQQYVQQQQAMQQQQQLAGVGAGEQPGMGGPPSPDAGPGGQPQTGTPQQPG